MNGFAVTQTRTKSPAMSRRVRVKKIINQMLKNKVLYLFLVPALTYIIIFHYFPLYGIQIAFKDFTPSKGIWESPWVGFKYFEKFFNSYHFWDLLRNTLSISVYQLLIGFPFPIMLALLINYTPSMWLKKVTQTVTYAPHFLSIVVLVGMMFVFLSPTNGIVNIVIQ